ncbi:hypothetical protein POMI540_2377 [Schizosaccharomyces pombe]|uniref:Uncharacterized protein C7D4.12c n=1 Tax=Schizosaccharomyces pombe (strain 972 / ATCC 24843) TaxID=284812 RepID=YFPC_SCHPO|nr:uncharacterized protein SPAC7D4.12c [Schizosaccharomyces pombe]O14267.1 RecName: Full=Uncharacterized protein C7D4.12c [Schizosaccharomyces pombe 972h-]CAB16729.1 DUF1212 family protein [Schizosaccharomyces pombe]|eukprot:NP_593846.1 uncharacterized protein SPAC7D4.12c [Schizosaccharomyces pombe]
MDGNRRVRFNTDRRPYLSPLQTSFPSSTSFQTPTFLIEEDDEDTEDDDGPQVLPVHRAPSPAAFRKRGSITSMDQYLVNMPAVPSPTASKVGLLDARNTDVESYAASYKTQSSSNSVNSLPMRRPTLDRSYSAPMIAAKNLQSDPEKMSNVESTNELPSTTTEAYKLVAAHTAARLEHMRLNALKAANDEGEDVKDNEQDDNIDESDPFANPKASYRGGVLSNLLKLYTNSNTVTSSRISLKHTDPTKWQKHAKRTASSNSLTDLLHASNQTFMAPASGLQSTEEIPQFSKTGHSRGRKFNFHHHSRKNSGLNEEYKITIHLADILQRQKYILKLCRALMVYGAPSHRLEEHMASAAKVLEIEGQFLYIPGCMIVSFGDVNTHTSDMHIVRVNQTIDLGRLKLVHDIYKAVLHDRMGVEEAIRGLDEIFKSPPYFRTWILVVFYGFASATILPMSFQGGWIDLPIAFILGCLVGILQHYIAPRSTMYNSLFEVTGSIITSFLSRAFGSIRYSGGRRFCFSALAEGAIVLILPGYIVLCGSLELQSKNIVAGGVRMFYAIIYSLFLSFGISIGAALYGWMDHNATDSTSCPVSTQMDDKWKILFVPLFTLCLLIVNQARPSQWPVSIFISCAGYVVNYFTAKHFGSNPIANAIGSFAIGCLGNIYSRLGRGVAFAAVLPAIFVQVPSGLAAQGGISSGIEVATSLTNNTYNTSSSSTLDVNSLKFGLVMVQIAIGISVGLFASALVVYPFGKRRSGLFSF